MTSFWKVFISIIITLVISAGGTWYIADSIANQKLTAKDDQISSLQTALDTTNSKLKTATATTSTTTTTDETADWKTYTNTKYSYSVKYPDNWYIDSSVANSDLELNTKTNTTYGGDVVWSNYSFPDSQYKQSPADFMHIYFNIIKKDNASQTMESALQENGSTITGESTYTTSSGLSGIKWYQETSDTNGKNKYYHYAFEKGDNVFSFNVTDVNSSATESVINNQNTILGQLASTFQFTK